MRTHYLPWPEQEWRNPNDQVHHPMRIADSEEIPVPGSYSTTVRHERGAPGGEYAAPNSVISLQGNGGGGIDGFLRLSS